MCLAPLDEIEIVLSKHQTLKIEKTTDATKGIKVMLYDSSRGCTVSKMICVVHYTVRKTFAITEFKAGRLEKYDVTALREEQLSEYENLPHIVISGYGKRIAGFYDKDENIIILALIGKKNAYVIREICLEKVDERLVIK